MFCFYRSMSVASRSPGPIAAAINRKLSEGLRPTRLSVVNDSSKHAGHAGNPSGADDAETHFNIQVVSDCFAGKLPVARHRMIYQLLKDELDAGLHALQLSTKTPAEAAR